MRLAREVGGGAQCHVDPAWHGSRYVGDEVAGLCRPFPVRVGTVGMERVGGRWRHVGVWGKATANRGRLVPLSLVQLTSSF